MKVSHVALIVVGIVALAFFGAHQYAQTKQMAYTGVIVEKIDITRSTLGELATLTDRNAADATVEEIVMDCSSRSEFEPLLDRLHQLTASELQRVDHLFAACGGYFAQKKTYMAARMTEELSVLRTLSDLYNEASGTSERYAPLQAVWQEIVDLETQKGTLLREQVKLQGEVITALRGGSGVSSEEITNKLIRAQEIAQLLEVTDTRVDTAREREAAITITEEG